MRRRRRLLWRMALATTVALATQAVLFWGRNDANWTFDVENGIDECVRWAYGLCGISGADVPFALCVEITDVLLSLVSIAVAVAGYHYLTRNLYRDRRSRCRRCNVALENLSEARCPACAEPI